MLGRVVLGIALCLALSACKEVKQPPQQAVVPPVDFRILVDTNQITVDEAAHASRLAADGSWSIPINTTGALPAAMYAALGPWVVAEDNPTDTSQIDTIASAIGRPPDAALVYIEDGMATPVASDAVNAFVAHVIPGFGALGRRAILLTRSYVPGDPRRALLDASLLNPNVAGAAFEFTPDPASSFPSLHFDEGCAHIVALGKDCYLLIPPNANSSATTYLADVQSMVEFFRTTLTSPHVFVVLAQYVQPNKVHMLSTAPGDPNAMETVVAWLKAWRAANHRPVFPEPPPPAKEAADTSYREPRAHAR